MTNSYFLFKEELIMAKIICPNNQYTGTSATVTFVNGVGETNDQYLINWFKDNGYTVIETKPQEPAETPVETSKEGLGWPNDENDIDGKVEVVEPAEEVLTPEPTKAKEPVKK
jgi:hypothetical protein